MDLELTGKKVVVTGASQGIGLATARCFAREGAEVYAVARSAAPAETGLIPVRLDLTRADAGTALAEMTGDADVLVNNLGGAASGGPSGGFLELDDDAWAATFDLNLFGTVRVTRALLPGLLRRTGVIVNVSSIGARASLPGIDYGAAKAALTNLSKALAEEFGRRGLRVLTVSPGPTRTPLMTGPDGPVGQLAQAMGRPIEEVVAGLPVAMGITTGRLTEPEEIGALIAFAASARGGNLTGADLIADGGVLKAV